MGDEANCADADAARTAMTSARCERGRGRMSDKTRNPGAMGLFSELRDAFDYQWEMMNGPDRHQ
ncbi:MAG: hypothetical protein AW12_02993 [Candidatus Accumulibacter sp. BA-94]|nr:MAG: hypothetical protein AW12_02993 [Candidatus Accumulibacter sp. BA-94]